MTPIVLYFYDYFISFLCLSFSRVVVQVLATCHITKKHAQKYRFNTDLNGFDGI